MQLLKGFTTHRSWQDWLLLVLGALIFLSPALSASGYTGPAAASTVLVGLVMIFVSELEIVAISRWEEIINLICGAWMMVAPLALGYGGRLRLWHLGLGSLVVIITLLELWQDRQRDTTS